MTTALRSHKQPITINQTFSRFSSVALIFVLALIIAGPLAQAQQQPSTPRAATVLEIGMVVSDLDRAIDFYSQVLSFERVSDVEVYGPDVEHLEGLFGVRMRIVRMQLGEEILGLTEYLTPQGWPIPVDSRSNDRWFQHIAIITSDMDTAYRVLREHKVRHASTAPQLLPAYIKNVAGIRAFYFRDPDNHFLEILQFPNDKGDSKWHVASSKLFLGIDHTAIVIGDTDASVKFYRDALGMRVAGESENYGPEQEHLNNVFGARLRITALRGAAGPGIELLEYLAPRDGRPMPADSRTDDLWAWETTVSETDAASTQKALLLTRADFVSPGIVSLPDRSLGFARGFLVRDPDGHIIRVTQP
jgi:catechol 2,3-dioxygenase-like lactoylglutathione lyase family enzyme